MKKKKKYQMRFLNGDKIKVDFSLNVIKNVHSIKSKWAKDVAEAFHDPSVKEYVLSEYKGFMSILI